MSYVMLDAFCGAGGATKGYQRAGFRVVGVDIAPQPNYCGNAFIQGDALEFIDKHGAVFDGIHASPPCQAYSALKALSENEHPELVEQTREILKCAGVPYVIENVPGSPVEASVVLCGSQFGLGAYNELDGKYRQLRRHRLFECSGFSVMSHPCRHEGEALGVYGTGGGGKMTRGYKGGPQEYRDAMEMDWASRAEIAQAIPPAYTQFLGEALYGVLAGRAAA